MELAGKYSVNVAICMCTCAAAVYYMHHLSVFHITKGLWLWLMHVYTFLLHIGGDV